MSQPLLLAVASGVFAALAALFTKLVVDPRIVDIVDTHLCSHDAVLTDSLARHLCAQDDATTSPAVLRGTSGVLVALCNVLMWLAFTRALSISASTLHVTSANTAANLFTTALLGYAVFSERVTLRFLVGLAAITAGTILMNQSPSSPPPSSPKRKAE
ncbi:hypothetical protein RI367_006383 [Sorochytrium milnesiophthora]